MINVKGKIGTPEVPEIMKESLCGNPVSSSKMKQEPSNTWLTGFFRTPNSFCPTHAIVVQTHHQNSDPKRFTACPASLQSSLGRGDPTALTPHTWIHVQGPSVPCKGKSATHGIQQLLGLLIKPKLILL